MIGLQKVPQRERATSGAYLRASLHTNKFLRVLSQSDSYYYDIAHCGMHSADSNCNVHAKMLYDYLVHRKTLSRRSAIDELDEKIRFEARQVERILGISPSNPDNYA